MTDAEVAIAKLNNFIKVSKEAKVFDSGKISDGYHTFDELYDHRITLFVVLCNRLWSDHMEFDLLERWIPWKSKKHSDDTMFEGWFIVGIGKEKGEQITYHLPIEWWKKVNAQELEKAPVWDGHTPADVLKRLLEL